MKNYVLCTIVFLLGLVLLNTACTNEFALKKKAKKAEQEVAAKKDEVKEIKKDGEKVIATTQDAVNDPLQNKEPTSTKVSSPNKIDEQSNTKVAQPATTNEVADKVTFTAPKKGKKTTTIYHTNGEKITEVAPPSTSSTPAPATKSTTSSNKVTQPSYPVRSSTSTGASQQNMANTPKTISGQSPSTSTTASSTDKQYKGTISANNSTVKPKTPTPSPKKRRRVSGGKKTNDTNSRLPVVKSTSSTSCLDVNQMEAAPKRKIQWMSVSQAAAAHKVSPKKWLVYIYTDWCQMCPKMEEKPFSNSIISDYAAKKYYPVKINAEDKQALQILDRHFKFLPDEGQNGLHELALYLLRGDASFPAVVIWNEKLDNPQPRRGYTSPLELYKVMLYFGDNYHTQYEWGTYNHKYNTKNL